MANDEIKKEIEEHLNRAVQLQKELESLVEKIRTEIEEVKTLSQKAEGAQPEVFEEEKKEAGEILEIEEVTPEVEIPEEAAPEPAAPEEEVPEAEGAESGVDFTKELEKVKKIKEMLGAPEEVEPTKEEAAEEIEVEEKVEEPAPEADVSFEKEEKAEPAEAPPSEEEIEVAIGEEPVEEVEKASEIEEKEAFEAPALEKEPEISIEEKPLPEEEKVPEVEVEKPVEEAPPVEKEPEAPLEEKPIPEEKEVGEVEESDTMQTMFSGRWKKHWQDKPAPGEEPEEKPEEMPAAAPEEEKTPDIHERETVEAPAPEEKAEETIKTEAQPEVEVEPQVEVKPEAEMVPGEVAAEVGPPKGRRASDILEVLEKIKKTEPEEGGEVCYYEHQGKILVDSECIITAMHSHLEEGKTLYEKLALTESPKDQFFVKQEIIRHQEALRGIVETATKLLEKEDSSLPQHTTEVINEKVLKDLLENLSMQNWSNQDDFTFFDEYAIKVKAQFDALIEPKVDFLKSILVELGI